MHKSAILINKTIAFLINNRVKCAIFVKKCAITAFVIKECHVYALGNNDCAIIAICYTECVESVRPQLGIPKSQTLN
jgi:hypothetical protein